MTTYTVRARNTAADSSNRMHDDAVAQGFGFSGGLVPGADVWAYMSHPLVEAWGLDWLTSGTMEVRFRAPVYDGDEVTVEVAADGAADAVTLSARNGAGILCATGRATRVDTSPPPSVDDFPAAELPDGAPPAACAEWFLSQPVLGTLDAQWSAERGAAYADSVGETSALLRDGGIAPPGLLVGLTDLLVVANVTLRPWIFAQARVRHHAVIRHGDLVSVRGTTAGIYDRNGHRFVDIDILMLTPDERPLFSARKVVIYEPRERVR